jgi:hypothetical protein
MARTQRASFGLPPHVRRVRLKGREYFYFQANRGTWRQGPRVKLPGTPFQIDGSVDVSRVFCKEYFELKAEGARASESERLRETIAQLSRERVRLEDQGAGREADQQAVVLSRALGIRTGEVERGLTLFLGVLVEVGAALGLYFATGHMRLPSLRDTWSKGGVTVIEGEVLKVAHQKRIAAVVPRRVPRVRHG